MTSSSPAAEARRRWPAFDGHVDLLHTLQQQGAQRPFLDHDRGPVTPASLAAGGVRLLASAVYCADAHNGPERAAAWLRSLLAAEERLLAGLPAVRMAADLSACWAGEGPPGRLRLLENADALLEFGVAAACTAGIVTVGLTHAGRNRLADGNAVRNPGGLTPAGRQLLGELGRAGQVVDLAHLAAPGFWQVLAAYPGALVTSHTGLRHFCDLPRNLDAGQIDALMARGGLVGVAIAPELLGRSGEADLELVFRHIDYLVQRHGSESVCLGSDLGGFDGICRGFEDHADLPALARRLRQAGYPAAAVAGIMGENWRRFYAAVLPG